MSCIAEMYGRNAKSILFSMHFRVHLGAKKILTLFVIVLHIIMHGRPIWGYESLKELFMLFKVNNNMLKCSLDTSGCGIAKAHA